jgi:transcriptional regulator with XRE-family HTH domain
VNAILEQAHQLKQALVDFVLDAEGELAQALETYAAVHLRRGSGDNIQQELIIDSFLVEGKVDDKSPLELFIESREDLSESNIDDGVNLPNLIKSWHRSFVGLFAISDVLSDGFEFRNWLTDKYYIVKPSDTQTLEKLSRLKVGEIILTRIFPVNNSYWMFSSPYTIMGKLGKPKLAVAIGNFKENYKNNLYSDAPDLLEEAWLSVEKYHHDFVDFFGSDEITLPGYQLNKKIAEFQELITDKRLAEAGIDSSKSLAEMAAEAGVSEAEIETAAQEFGADSQVVSQILQGKTNNGKSKMVMPKVDLPAELRKAEQVTAISHPRWGQMFLPTYSRMQTILSDEDEENIEGNEKLIRHYLEDKSINAFIWYRLAAKYPTQLEKVLQDFLQRPEFKINDLDSLLQEFDKPIEPDLPEIASVPIHLHNLFQEALTEINKSKPKAKGQKKPAKGFQ